jgi:plastocyanin
MSTALILASPAAAAPTHAMPMAPAVAAKAATVTIGNFTFGPMTVAIPAGGTVTWINADDVPHTVVASDLSFRSHPIDTDERFSLTFAKPGVYSYFCSLHPRMVGKIVVR